MFHELSHQISHSIARVSRGGHQADVLSGVRILMEESSIDTLLCQTQDHLILPLDKLQLGVVGLTVYHVSDVLVLVALPLV